MPSKVNMLSPVSADQQLRIGSTTYIGLGGKAQIASADVTAALAAGWRFDLTAPWSDNNATALVRPDGTLAGVSLGVTDGLFAPFGTASSVSVSAAGILSVDTPGIGVRLGYFLRPGIVVYLGATLATAVPYTVTAVTGDSTATVLPASALSFQAMWIASGVAQWFSGTMPVMALRNMQGSLASGGFGDSAIDSGALELMEIARPYITQGGGSALALVARNCSDPTNPNLRNWTRLTFTDATHYDVSTLSGWNPNGTTVTSSGNVYAAGTPININGWSLTFTGAGGAAAVIDVQSTWIQIGAIQSGGSAAASNGYNFISPSQIEFWADGGVSIRGLSTGIGLLQWRDKNDSTASLWGIGAVRLDTSNRQSSAYIGTVALSGHTTDGSGLGFVWNAFWSLGGNMANTFALFNGYGWTYCNAGSRAAGIAHNVPSAWAAANAAQVLLDGVTTAAGSAPLKFRASSGAAKLTTPEDGAFEYDGTSLFFTVGASRKTVTLV
jgi:hypothetical protein